MTSPWHARIDQADGRTAGSGFLIDDRHVLTCAHVVHDLGDPVVVFPAADPSLRCSAAVVHRGPWRPRTAPRGDVAVLELARPVRITPARLADPTDAGAWRDSKLFAYGVAKGKTDSGAFAELRIDDRQIMADEWCQLNAWDGHGQFIERGFSGAAVYLPGTGEVVGMVTDADLAAEQRVGRMLPISTLRRYWEPLDDLLPHSWPGGLGAGPRGELRRHLTGATTGISPRALLADEFPLLSHQGEPSLWRAVVLAAEEIDEDGALTRFLTRIIARMDDRSRAAEVRQWRTRYLGPGPDTTAVPASVAIIVRIAPSGLGGYLLEFSIWRADGSGWTRPLPGPVAEDQVRASVEREIPRLLAEVAGEDFIIEFMLPDDWFTRRTGVENWSTNDDPADSLELGLLYPVVIRDLARRRGGSQRWDQAIKRWRRLRELGCDPPGLVGCRDRATLGWLADEARTTIVHATSPNLGHIRKALKFGIPIMVWPRSSCRAEQHDDCRGNRFLSEVAAIVEKSTPDQLPDRIKHLRRAGMNDKPVQKISLFWDDPTRMPDPPLAPSREGD
ncbi:trypsin-like peptidase domain-containing protein [Nonomuraea lactucae]|uniref:VMAP-C domain-containing protein n=1 Tax=Nonomuraea lactucae TaxID=2249762 RepID=UPI0013B38FC1|nr:trypsin-like peptidase domain-containing protein [Nonomuraea lactucae]